MTPDFKEFPKIARLSRECVITEKIDGTNASIFIGEDGQFLAGSRSGWITPQKDNFGFAAWAEANKTELLKLGPGHHFGEWWGQGIQRGYGLKEKRFSLFNVVRWCLHGQTPKEIPTGQPKTAIRNASAVEVRKVQDILPPCVSLVPLLWQGVFDTAEVLRCLTNLRLNGSQAIPGFMKPEGVVVFHFSANIGFKKTIDQDEIPKQFMC